MLAPFDRDVRATALLHRGARPQVRERPEWLVPLGGTIGWPSNGAVSNLAHTPSPSRRCGGSCARALRRRAPARAGRARRRLGRADLADAPARRHLPLLLESGPPHLIAALLGARRKLNHLTARIAVSEAAAWTGRRFYGGHYRVIPNGVTLPAGGVPAPRARAPGEPLRIAFVGQAVERKGLPVLLRAFEALRGQVPAELTIVGVDADEIAPLLLDAEGVTALGRVDDDARDAALEAADVLCAPSLGGESFGMVLTEAFAAGTPVVASDIAGYRDVVADGADGLLVPRGDATRWPRRCATSRSTRRARAASAPRRRAAPSATRGRGWPSEVAAAYEDARAVPAPRAPSARRGPRRRARRPTGAALARAPAAVARAAAAARRGAGSGSRAAP